MDLSDGSEGGEYVATQLTAFRQLSVQGPGSWFEMLPTGSGVWTFGPLLEAWAKPLVKSSLLQNKYKYNNNNNNILTSGFIHLNTLDKV